MAQVLTSLSMNKAIMVSIISREHKKVAQSCSLSALEWEIGQSMPHSAITV